MWSQYLVIGVLWFAIWLNNKTDGFAGIVSVIFFTFTDLDEDSRMELLLYLRRVL